METLIRVYSFSVVFNYLFMVFIFFTHRAICQLYVATNTLGVNQSLNQHLESSNGRFRLHFAREGHRSYLAIHYNYGPNYIPVWVAFPEKIFYSGYLRMEQDGHLIMTYWSSPRDIEYISISLNIHQSIMVRNSVATLLDNGNLVVRDGSRILWQSFDYPSNTWLPGMKIGVFGLNNYNNERRRFLTSWIAGNNPSPGVFTLGIDLKNTTEILVMKRGLPYWSSGNYSRQNISSLEKAFFNILGTTEDCFSGENESYCSFTGNESSFFRLTDWGTIELFSYYMLYGEIYTCNDSFRGYGSFHPSGYCIDESSSIGNTNCKLKLMVPGQARTGTMDGWSFYSKSADIGLIDCQDLCKQNCSCLAYTNASSDGTGCKFYTTEHFTYSDLGETIHFLREFNSDTGARNHQRDLKIKFAVGAASGAFLLIILTIIFVLKRTVFNTGARKHDIEDKDDNDRLIAFRLMDIKTGTNNFSDANKLGQGGFGPGYKGKLHDGQEIAVKRLSTVTKHGMEQFKNEVLLISKLQHRNLVSLLGYCSEGDEWLLVYEYLPNKSLDSFIFDAAKQACLLNWRMRVHIIQGIAQGLLYLHKYSRLKIIHRDLKTSNILLDNYMNPKIADFGTARIFQDSDSRLNTKRIIGTYGYMSPEYAIDGHFSEKSDVFSFGVMVLEIISGKKNTGFYNSDHLNLLGYVWDLWIDGRIIDMADPTLSETLCKGSCLRYVQVALMCVQENAADRPVMIDVVSMLTNESIALPIPNQPAFCTLVPTKNGQTFASQQPISQNKLTISAIDGR